MANRAYGWNLKNHHKQMKENKKRLAYRKFVIRASEGRKAAMKTGVGKWIKRKNLQLNIPHITHPAK